MAVALRGSISGRTAVSNLTLSSTTGWSGAPPQAGDVIICIQQNWEDVGNLTPAGFTTVDGGGFVSALGGIAVEVSRRNWTAGDGNYLIQTSGSIMSAQLLAFSGVDTTTPLDGTASGIEYSFNTVTAIAAAGITPSRADSYLVAIYSGADAVGATLRTFSTPASMTALATTAVNLTPWSTIYSFGQQLAAAGATGTRTSTYSNGASNNDKYAVMLALRTAATAAPAVSTGGAMALIHQQAELHDAQMRRFRLMDDDDALFILPT